MNDGSKSFHLQTPFADLHKLNRSVSGASTNKDKHVAHYNITSAQFPTTEGTFAEVSEYSNHLSALKDLEELRDQYYEQYLSNLESKVIKQRKNLAKKTNVDRDPQDERVRSKKLKNKLPHHRLKHDKEYMRNVTKSRFYHLIATRDLLRKKGLLKSRADEEAFWSKVESDSSIWSQPPPSGVPPNVVTRVMLNRFSSMSINVRPKRERFVTFSQNTAISPSEQQKKDCNVLKEDDPLKKFKVKMTLPKLHSFSTSVLPPIQPCKTNLHSSERKERLLKKLHAKREAYDVAMVNQAITKKLMRAHELFGDDNQRKILHEVDPRYMDAFPEPSKQTFDNYKRGMESRVFITEPVYGTDRVLIPDLEYKYVSGTMSKKHKHHFKAKEHGFTEPKTGGAFTYEMETTDQLASGDAELSVRKSYEKFDFLPLSYTMMLENTSLPVKKATSMGSLWVNYVKDD